MMTPNRSCGRILVATLVAIYFIGLAHWALAESAAHSTAATAPGASDESISKESSGASQETAINPLEFKTDLALWTAVVFLLLLAVLWKFAWGPLAEGLDKRERHIADQIFQANEANQKAKDLLADYEKKLADSQNEVRAILEKGRRDADQVGRAMLEKAKADAKAEGERMLKQIDAATTSAIKELADRSAALAVELAGKIVHARLNPKDHAKLIEQAVAGFAEGKSGISRN
ncbi:MAG: F0F1 ATP synthase subunit B [Thermoguttaceae bacterium]